MWTCAQAQEKVRALMVEDEESSRPQERRSLQMQAPLELQRQRVQGLEPLRKTV